MIHLTWVAVVVDGTVQPVGNSPAGVSTGPGAAVISTTTSGWQFGSSGSAAPTSVRICFPLEVELPVRFSPPTLGRVQRIPADLAAHRIPLHVRDALLADQAELAVPHRAMPKSTCCSLSIWPLKCK